MKSFAYTTAVLALLATSGFAIAQEANPQPPAAAMPADCPAAGTVPDAELSVACKAAKTAMPADQKSDAVVAPVAPDATTGTAASEVAPTTAPADVAETDLMAMPTSGMLVTNLIGQKVYTAADEHIGEVRDVIFNKEKGAIGVVVGVGGFLGIGEKDVAVPIDQFTTVTLANNASKLTIKANRTQLEAAPAFDRKASTMQLGG